MNSRSTAAISADGTAEPQWPLQRMRAFACGTNLVPRPFIERLSARANAQPLGAVNVLEEINRARKDVILAAEFRQSTCAHTVA